MICVKKKIVFLTLFHVVFNIGKWSYDEFPCKNIHANRKLWRISSTFIFILYNVCVR